MNKRFWIPVDLYIALENNPDGVVVECRGGAPVVIKILKPEKEATDNE